jgi:hypothetical protein
MLKKSLVFGGIALVAFTLLVLVGCPDVVSNGPPNTGEVQGNLTVTASAAGGDVIVIKLKAGKFKSTLATDTTITSKFEIEKPDGTEFDLGTSPTYKLASDTVFTITVGAGADPMPTTGNLKVTIPSAAIDSGVVVKDGQAEVETSPKQGDIAVQTSAAQAVIGANAIVVKLPSASTGSFASELAGDDFIDESTSVIRIDENSEVVVSDGGKTATIYGNPAVAAGAVKVGIRASAFLGYPVVTATDVTVSSAKETGQRPITVSIIPTSGDNFITLVLGGGGTFDSDAEASNFTLGSSATGAVTGLQIKSNTRAVIKVGTPFGTADFTLKIAAAAFDDATTVYPRDVTPGTTKQADVVVTPIATSSSTEEVLTITILNGGKFITSPELTLFTKTGNDSVTFTGSPVLSSNDTVAKITLSGDTTDSQTLGVTIDADAFDPDFLVELDDILSLSLGDT